MAPLCSMSYFSVLPSYSTCKKWPVLIYRLVKSILFSSANPEVKAGVRQTQSVDDGWYS